MTVLGVRGLGEALIQRQRRADCLKVAQSAVFAHQVCLIKDLSTQVLLRDRSFSYFV
jgi:hypothetical protein